MTDYYPDAGCRPEDPCCMNQPEFDAENQLTILDPALAPIASIEQLNPVPRRRLVRR